MIFRQIESLPVKTKSWTEAEKCIFVAIFLSLCTGLVYTNRTIFFLSDSWQGWRRLDWVRQTIEAKQKAEGVLKKCTSGEVLIINFICRVDPEPRSFLFVLVCIAGGFFVSLIIEDFFFSFRFEFLFFIALTRVGFFNNGAMMACMSH